MKFDGKSIALKWHQPLCSSCREPIDTIEEAYAGWYEDDDHQAHSPQIVHVGDSGCRYYKRFPHGHIVGDFVMDVPVRHFRRVPMEAIIIAMRRRSSTEAERVVWHEWVSIALGLPFSSWDILGMHEAHNDVGEILATVVHTVAEVAEGLRR